jgi:hypothetical protein
MENTLTRKNALTANLRFGVMAAEARRKSSTKMTICAPHDHLWKPPLRQAAGSLAAMRRKRCREQCKELIISLIKYK